MSTKIKSIKVTKTETFIGFVTSEQPRDVNKIVNDKSMKRSDLPRHADFEFAMDKLKPHLLIACGFMPPKDFNGNYLQSVHFNDFFADTDEEKERFGWLEMTGILIQGKHAVDGVQLFGTKVAPNGDLVKIKTPPIPLKRVSDGWNYDLVEILDTQIDKLLFEADLFNQRKKHGAGMQTQAELPPAKPNANAKSKMAAVKEEQEQENLVNA